MSNAYLKCPAPDGQVGDQIAARLACATTAGRIKQLLHSPERGPPIDTSSRTATRPGIERGLARVKGLAIWHIDELGDNRNERTAAQHYEISPVQADGRN